MTTFTAEPPYTWVSDTDWSLLDDPAQHMDAGLWIRRALRHIADQQRDPDLWEAGQLEAAIHALGAGQYRTAGMHGRAAMAEGDERDPSLMDENDPKAHTLRELEALFDAHANRRPIPAARG